MFTCLHFSNLTCQKFSKAKQTPSQMDDDKKDTWGVVVAYSSATCPKCFIGCVVDNGAIIDV